MNNVQPNIRRITFRITNNSNSAINLNICKNQINIKTSDIPRNYEENEANSSSNFGNTRLIDNVLNFRNLKFEIEIS